MFLSSVMANTTGTNAGCGEVTEEWKKCVRAEENDEGELNDIDSTTVCETMESRPSNDGSSYELQMVIVEKKPVQKDCDNKNESETRPASQIEATILDAAIRYMEQRNDFTPKDLLILKNWPDKAGAGDIATLKKMQDDVYQSEIDESTHCHVANKPSSSVQKARNQLIISTCLCLIFLLAEFVGGYLSNSLAIMTDAAHLLSDLAGFLISLFALWVGQKAPTKRMSFGYYRAEILGAVASVLFIWVLTGVLVYMAVNRVRYQDYEIDADAMLIVAGVGVVVNIIMGLVLHNPCGKHNHGHGHSHGIQSSQSLAEDDSSSHNPQNINVRAAFIHVVGDLVQSIGVLIAALIIRYKPEYKLADPICTFIFSVLVMFTTLSVMKDAVLVLMEGFPRNLNYGDVKNALTSVKGVKDAHNLHIWSLTVDKNTLSVHLAVDPEMDPHAVLQEAQVLVRRLYKIYHCTIQVEKYDPGCMVDCQACQGPQV